MNELNVIDFPVANNPSHDSVQVLDLNTTTRTVHELGLSTFISARQITLAPETKLIELEVFIYNFQPDMPYIEVVSDGMDEVYWPLVPGRSYIRAVTDDTRQLTFRYPFDFATVFLREIA